VSGIQLDTSMHQNESSVGKVCLLLIQYGI